ncbi:MAG: hypothetical protein K9G03_00180 [Pontimonas sp.]|nr:hypothetical protein [Pontimonas sp.]
MRQQTTSPRTFSAATSWVGVVLLGAGLTQIALPPTQATSPGPQTASVEYQGFDDFFGVLSGGSQRDFITGLNGWQSPAFDSLGMMGLEWTTATGTEARRDISPDPGTASPSPGGDSSWTTPGYLSANPNNQIYTEKTISLSGNQVRFSMRHRSLADESAIDRRLYWVAQLSDGYNPSYSGAGTSTLLITDSSGSHPSVIIHVTSAAGTPTFEGGESIYTPLVDGDRSPTLYLLTGDATDFTMDITVGIIDADPCSASAASTFAASHSGEFGSTWESITSCALPATWSITADGEPSAPLTMAFAEPYQPSAAPATRTLELSGLPAGVTWERASDAGGSLRATLSASASVEPGTYPVVWSSRERHDSNGVVTLSRPSTSTATLSILAAPLVPVLEEEPAALTEPTDVSALAPNPGPAPEVGTVVAQPLDPAPAITPVTPSFEIPEILPPREESPPSPLVSPSRERAPRVTSEMGSDIPEPVGAGVWLGAGTGVLAGGSILAALRRRFARARNTDVEGSERIE